jgi:hypothetical protein
MVADGLSVEKQYRARQQGDRTMIRYLGAAFVASLSCLVHPVVAQDGAAVEQLSKILVGPTWTCTVAAYGKLPERTFSPKFTQEEPGKIIIRYGVGGGNAQAVPIAPAGNGGFTWTGSTGWTNTVAPDGEGRFSGEARDPVKGAVPLSCKKN